MEEAPAVSDRSSDASRKRGSGSLSCPMRRLQSVSKTSVSHLLNQKVPLANLEPPQQRTEIPIDPQLLDHYTGRYQVTPQLILEITRDGDRLFAQAIAQAMNGPKFELFAESEKKFFAKVTDKQIAFDTGPDGRATRLTLYSAGRQPMTAARVS